MRLYDRGLGFIWGICFAAALLVSVHWAQDQKEPKKPKRPTRAEAIAAHKALFPHAPPEGPEVLVVKDGKTVSLGPLSRIPEATLDTLRTSPGMREEQ